MSTADTNDPVADALEYVFRYPKSIPDGKWLVHNQVTVGITPKRRPGVKGFRAWLAEPDPELLVPCDCGWASELGRHFRLRRVGCAGNG